MAESLYFDDSRRPVFEPFLPDQALVQEATNTRPHVTLTYACSLDAMIAAAPGTRTALSGVESKSMTHYLRTRHDAILVGCGTANADDPSLNSRIGGITLAEQPRPIILDGRGRWQPKSEAKVLRAAHEGKGKSPWVITTSAETHIVPNEAVRPLLLEPGQLNWPSILHQLASQGIRSVMIEGGAEVINTLLGDHVDLIDSLIVTVAAVYLGSEGVRVIPVRPLTANIFSKVDWLTLGRDSVMCASIRRT